MKRRAAALMAIATVLTGAAGCASHDTQVALQRPGIPNNQAFRIPYDHALRGSVTIDYISGMSQYSFFFAEANRSQFRPALEQVLDRSGMLAKTPAAARYGLQVEFVDLQGSFFGADFDSRSRAIYRIVERRSGRVVSQQTVDAGFMARYVGLTEEDAAAAYWLTIAVAAGGLAHYVGADNQVKAWRQAYQATLWSTLFAPVNAITPGNFIAGGDFFGNTDVPRPYVLHGDLSTEGYGSRDGRTRGIQADRQMMRQSLAKWVMGLSEEQGVPLTVILPCDGNIEVENIKLELTMRGIPYRGETCHMRPVRVIH
ncbi:hypothetical protein GCM10009422_02930 [Brevundimonas kwangchunensis]|uniref:Lipoprotein n=1 Tax=Brevundimonas kwangchunensis TaxID=322163 RepID=A0ABN1GH49_9CAUL